MKMPRETTNLKMDVIVFFPVFGNKVIHLKKTVIDYKQHIICRPLIEDLSENYYCSLQITSLATVIGLRQESTTVKSLRLKIHDERLTFKAGQW